MADPDTIGAIMSAVNTFLTAAPRSLPASAIAWENKIFDPAGKAIWAKVSHVPNQPEVASLGSRGIDRGTGFFQIDINVPEGTGDSVLRTWEDYARGYFIAGNALKRNAQTVVIISCGVSQGRIVENWYRKSITVAYRSDFIRQPNT